MLAVIDVNHFKQINDTCGHLTGDHALIETARRLGSMLNEGDIAGRIGGDEFIALFRGVPSMGAPRKTHRRTQARAVVPLAGRPFHVRKHRHSGFPQ